MTTARFRFADALSPFLAPERRGTGFGYECARAANLKNAIEALGVPHTEVGAVLVNGAPATLQRTVRDGDYVEVFACELDPGVAPVFLADAHLGALARFLRMLGFDTVHDQALPDREIRRIAQDERRIVLTRDRDLLKCREIERGCYVRSPKPEARSTASTAPALFSLRASAWKMAKPNGASAVMAAARCSCSPIKTCCWC